LREQHHDDDANRKPVENGLRAETLYVTGPCATERPPHGFDIALDVGDLRSHRIGPRLARSGQRPRRMRQQPQRNPPPPRRLLWFGHDVAFVRRIAILGAREAAV
jgi:hypothetical protein